ncbi:MAG: tetratricopeptide repeat protein [Alphaproteobacteria bacterium]|nr:tetratricopeptide repeat protein [Alphaproteobacteria bacterium]
MGYVLPLLVFVAALVLAAPLHADQRDPRLEPLFETLKSTGDLSEVGNAEQAIWGIWMESGDEEIDKLLTQGSIYMQMHSFGAALSHFNSVIAARPEFAEGWNKRATLYFMMGEYDKSIADCEKTFTLEPRHFGALFGLGLIYSQIDNEAKALDAFEKALAVHPHLQNVPAIIQRLKAKLKSQEI